jgi:hypothetical protein
VGLPDNVEGVQEVWPRAGVPGVVEARGLACSEENRVWSKQIVDIDQPLPGLFV